MCQCFFNRELITATPAGVVNINGYEQWCREKKMFLPGLLFDSYSPLCNSKRGRGIGGFKEFSDGSYFGCCACIGSAGFGLYPLMSVSEYGEGFGINYLLDGTYIFEKSGCETIFEVSGNKITIHTEKPFEGGIRITRGGPSLSVKAFCDKKSCEENGFIVFDGSWCDRDTIEIKTVPALRKTIINSKRSLCYSDFVLAADTAKTDIDFVNKRTEFAVDETGEFVCSPLAPEEGERVRLSFRTNHGDLILTDYASCGQDGDSVISVWF